MYQFPRMQRENERTIKETKKKSWYTLFPIVCLRRNIPITNKKIKQNRRKYMDYLNGLREGGGGRTKKKRKKLGVLAVLFNNVVSTRKPNMKLECM
jgi:hypothetical protein